MKNVALITSVLVSALLSVSAAIAQDTAEPTSVQETIVSVQGDWEVRCESEDTGCYMYQLVPVFETRLVELAKFLPVIDNPGEAPSASEIDALIPQIKDGTLTRKAVVTRSLNTGAQTTTYQVLEGGDILAAAQQAGVEELDLTFSVPMIEVRVLSLDGPDNVLAGVNITTPLRTLLSEGLSLQVDTGNQQRYQFLLCDLGGCLARFGLTENGLNAFRRGNTASVRIVSADRRDAPVNLDVSLRGFTAAFKELQSH